MFYKTKINKNINKKKGVRNYCDDNIIVMDGIWVMKGYPKLNAPLKKTLDTMIDVKNIESAIEGIKDRDFNRELILTPISYKGNRALYNKEEEEYYFINEDYLEMINLDKCDILGTDYRFDPILFQNKYDEEQWLIIMPVKTDGYKKWLKTL